MKMCLIIKHTNSDKLLKEINKQNIACLKPTPSAPTSRELIHVQHPLEVPTGRWLHLLACQEKALFKISCLKRLFQNPCGAVFT